MHPMGMNETLQTARPRVCRMTASGNSAEREAREWALAILAILSLTLAPASFLFFSRHSGEAGSRGSLRIWPGDRVSNSAFQEALGPGTSAAALLRGGRPARRGTGSGTELSRAEAAQGEFVDGNGRYSDAVRSHSAGGAEGRAGSVVAFAAERSDAAGVAAAAAAGGRGRGSYAGASGFDQAGQGAMAALAGGDREGNGSDVAGGTGEGRGIGPGVANTGERGLEAKILGYGQAVDFWGRMARAGDALAGQLVSMYGNARERAITARDNRDQAKEDYAGAAGTYVQARTEVGAFTKTVATIRTFNDKFEAAIPTQEKNPGYTYPVSQAEGEGAAAAKTLAQGEKTQAEGTSAANQVPTSSPEAPDERHEYVRAAKEEMTDLESLFGEVRGGLSETDRSLAKVDAQISQEYKETNTGLETQKQRYVELSAKALAKKNALESRMETAKQNKNTSEVQSLKQRIDDLGTWRMGGVAE